MLKETWTPWLLKIKGRTDGKIRFESSDETKFSFLIVLTFVLNKSQVVFTRYNCSFPPVLFPSDAFVPMHNSSSAYIYLLSPIFQQVLVELLQSGKKMCSFCVLKFTCIWASSFAVDSKSRSSFALSYLSWSLFPPSLVQQPKRDICLRPNTTCQQSS